MTQNTVINDFIKKTADNQLIALEIFEAQEVVLQSLLDSLNEEIAAYCKEQGYNIEEKRKMVSEIKNPTASIRLLRIEKDDWQGMEIGFEFAGGHGSGFCYGIIDPNENSLERFKVREGYSEYQNSALWPIYNYFDDEFQNWSVSFDPWKSMIRPTAGGTSPLMEVFKTKIEELEQVLLAALEK
jgi:hypothetical protein